MQVNLVLDFIISKSCPYFLETFFVLCKESDGIMKTKIRSCYIDNQLDLGVAGITEFSKIM